MAELIYAGDAGIFKSCSKCGEVKPSHQFSQQKTVKSGLRSACRDCECASASAAYEKNKDTINAEKREAYAANPAPHRARALQWHFDNHEASTAKARAWRASNPEAVSRANREYYAANKTNLLAKYAAWASENSERRKAYMAGWYADNPSKYSEYHRKRSESPRYRVENAVRCRIWDGITSESKAGRRTFDLLGYDIDDLKIHLEAKFLPGMTWANYGRGWHIDHIRPLSSFWYNTPEDQDFQRAWSLSNLQPLWAADNLAKGAKWQPAQDEEADAA